MILDNEFRNIFRPPYIKVQYQTIAAATGSPVVSAKQQYKILRHVCSNTQHSRTLLPV